MSSQREWAKKHALSLSEGPVQQGRLAYYVLEGVSFVLARSCRARTARFVTQGKTLCVSARSVLSST